MAGAAHVQRHIGFALDLDGFGTRLECRPTVGRLVMVRMPGLHALDIQVLHIEARYW